MQQTTSGSCFQSNAAATVNNQLVGYTYDAPGNLIKNSGTTYFYDDENRLIQVNGTLGNCSTAAQCYSYDAMGRRTEKLGGSTWNDRIYDLSNQVVAQATAGGAQEHISTSTGRWRSSILTARRISCRPTNWAARAR